MKRLLFLLVAALACTESVPAPGPATDSLISLEAGRTGRIRASTGALTVDSLIAVYTWPKSCSGPNCADYYTASMTERRVGVAVHSVLAPTKLTTPSVRVASSPSVAANDTAVRVLTVTATRKGKTSYPTVTTFTYPGPIVVTPPPPPPATAPAVPTNLTISTPILIDSVLGRIASTVAWTEPDTGAITYTVTSGTSVFQSSDGTFETPTSIVLAYNGVMPGDTVGYDACVTATRAGLTSAPRCASSADYIRPLPAATVADSGRIETVAVYSDTSKLTLTYRVFPVVTSPSLYIRWLVNGVQVAHSDQVAHYSTTQIPRGAALVDTIVGMVRLSGQTAEIAMRPFVFVSRTAPPPPVAVPPAVPVATIDPPVLADSTLGRVTALLHWTEADTGVTGYAVVTDTMTMTSATSLLLLQNAVLPGDTVRFGACVVAYRDTLASTTGGCATSPIYVRPLPPVVVDTMKLDSVKLSTPAIPSWDTTKTKVSLNYYVYPHPTGATYTVRWFINDSLVKTATQVQVTTSGGSTIQFLNTGYTSMKFVACARRSGTLQATETCSKSATWLAPVVTPPDTTTTTVADTGIGFYQLHVGPPANDYVWTGTQWAPGTDSLRLTLLTKSLVLADTGRHLFLTANSGVSWREVPAVDSQVVRVPRPAAGDSASIGVCGFSYDPTIKLYRRLCLAPVTGRCWVRQPTTPLPMPTPIPGVRQIVRLQLEPGCSVFATRP